jgi:hypothetical protein
MPLSDDEWSALARGLRRAAARVAPGWTDANAHDPGVTVLELLAYALEDLAYRNDRLSDEARAIARRIVEHASAIAGSDGGEGSPATGRIEDEALVRPRFVSGQLLTDDDLTAEQHYVRARIDRRNRALYGAGIVDGLAVAVDDAGGGAQVVVAPGLAFDGFGREIFVGCAQRLALRGAGTTVLVGIAYRERAERFTPAPADVSDIDNGNGDGAAQASRIVETFELSLAATPADDALPIARLRLLRGRWQVDPRFRATRVRR